jgi:hypothetical protein
LSEPTGPAPTTLRGLWSAAPQAFTRLAALGTSGASLLSTSVRPAGATTSIAPRVPAGAQVATRPAAERAPGTYPLAVVVLVGVVAFLLGSLLRSLLSPADFVFAGDAAAAVAGADGRWRELRRLVEIKYLVGGWDFQIALVRRP